MGFWKKLGKAMDAVAEAERTAEIRRHEEVRSAVLAARAADKAADYERAAAKAVKEAEEARAAALGSAMLHDRARARRKYGY